MAVLMQGWRGRGSVSEQGLGGAQLRLVGPGVSGWRGALFRNSSTAPMVLSMSPRTDPTSDGPLATSSLQLDVAENVGLLRPG